MSTRLWQTPDLIVHLFDGLDNMSSYVLGIRGPLTPAQVEGIKAVLLDALDQRKDEITDLATRCGHTLAIAREHGKDEQ